MNWLLISILGSAIYAVTNFIDKYILSSQIKDYRALIVYGSIVAFVFGCACWLFTGLPILALKDGLLVVITGILTIWGLAFYFRALSSEETSTVIILMQVAPVITLFLSASFLGESITKLQILGFLLIFLSAIAISIKKEHLQMHISKATLFILLADTLWAISSVIFKFVVSSASFSQLIAYESFGIVIGGLILFLSFPAIRASFTETKKLLSKTAILLIILNECFFLIAKIFTFYAISLGPVSLVTIIGSTQVFFGILYGWLLTVTIKKSYQEDISIAGIIKKVSVATAVFLGIWLMQY